MQELHYFPLYRLWYSRRLKVTARIIVTLNYSPPIADQGVQSRPTGYNMPPVTEGCFAPLPLNRTLSKSGFMIGDSKS